MGECRQVALHLHGAKGAAGAQAITLLPGTVTVLLGANGAGKTSLLETAAGLRDPGEAVIAYGDEQLWLKQGGGAKGARRLNAEALQRYGYASQAPEQQLICRTAEEELLAVLKPYRLSEQEERRRVAAALEAIGWDEAWLSRDPYRMSGGERRRLALACLFAVPASWLLIDEPTAGLDAAGQRLLAQQLRRSKASGTGVLLVSHDSEWSLPLADRVLLLSESGDMRECSREELLAHPEWWSEAGMEAPAWLATIAPLLRRGVPLESVWSPAELAWEWTQAGGQSEGAVPADGNASEAAANSDRSSSGIAARASRSAPGTVVHADGSPPVTAIRSDDSASGIAVYADRITSDTAVYEERTPQDDAIYTDRSASSAAVRAVPNASVTAVHAEDSSQCSQTVRLPLPRRQRDETAAHAAMQAFDPRSVWLAYVLLSLAIFTLRSWLGLAAAGAVTAAAVLLGQIPVWRWRGLILGYLIFSLTVSLVAGIGGGGIFSMDAFLTVLQSLARTFLVMLLGLGLALAMTPLKLRRSLDQLLSFRGQQPLMAQKFVLTVTLMLRFIPMFRDEWNRFSRYAIARGKEASVTLRSVPRRLRSTALPFLLSLFRLGDQVADALESRGVGRLRRKVEQRKLRWRKRDMALVVASIAVSAALWLFE